MSAETALLRRVVDAADAGRDARALRLLARLERAVPGSGWAAFYRAALALSRGRRREAAAAFASIEGVPPGLMFLGRHEPEIPAPAKHPRLRPQAAAFAARSRSPWAHILDACCRRDAGDRAGCDAAARRAARLAPQDPAVLAMSARLRYLLRLPAGAVRSMERAERLAPDCWWIAAWLGETRRYQGRFKEAAALLDRALRLEPGYGIAYSWRGAARRRLGRAKEALADFDRALAWLSADERHDFYSSAWARHERSLALRALGRDREALEDLAAAHRISVRYAWWGDPHRPVSPLQSPERLERLARRRPRDPEVWAWLGRAREAQGRLAEARAALDRAAALDPRHAWARAWRGSVALACGDPRAALRDLDAAARLDPDYPAAHFLRGKALMARGRPREAAGALGRALALDRIDAQSWAWRGKALLELGRKAQGVRHLREALALDPGFEDARRLLADAQR